MLKGKKMLAVLLSAVLLIAMLPAAAFADADTLTITDPYAAVDWNAVSAYKTGLHSHTNASDGDQTLRQSLQRHLEAGFDIVAISDHGTVNYSWSEPNPDPLIHGFLHAIGRNEGELDYLGTEGVFENGTAYTVETDAYGDDYLIADGRRILRVPFAIEQNAVSVNAHVNSWFTDYHDNSVTIYEDAVRGVDSHGGVCVINHPGEYTKARYELHSADAYNPANPAYRYYINKYATLIDRYDACIGIDMNSKGDNRTRFDRILWDTLLTRFSAGGGTVLGIASSDAHQLSVIDTGFTLLLMPELSSAAMREALENGRFFAASHCLGNYEELCEIAAALKAFYGENETYRSVSAAADEMAERIEGIETGRYDADESIGATWSSLDGDGRFAAASFPQVHGITVDDAENTVSFDAENALIVRMISNGRQIAVQPAQGAVFDLDDCADALGDYVRFEIFGEGGMVYTQAYLLNAAERRAEGKTPVTDGLYLNLGFLDFLFAEFHKLFAVLRRSFAARL